MKASLRQKVGRPRQARRTMRQRHQNSVVRVSRRQSEIHPVSFRGRLCGFGRGRITNMRASGSRFSLGKAYRLIKLDAEMRFSLYSQVKLIILHQVVLGVHLFGRMESL